MPECSPDGKNISFPTLHHCVSISRRGLDPQLLTKAKSCSLSLPFLTNKYSFPLISFTFFNFWPCHTACQILFPQPGTEPTPLNWKPEP